MAIENKIVSADAKSPALKKGEYLRSAIINFSVDSADDDGSIYRVASLPSACVILSATVENDAIAGATDYDFGLYSFLNGPKSGSVKDADKFSATVDFSSQRTSANSLNLVALPIGDKNKPLYELAGDSFEEREAEYDLAFTANTVGTATGVISVRIDYIVK